MHQVTVTIIPIFSNIRFPMLKTVKASMNNVFPLARGTINFTSGYAPVSHNTHMEVKTNICAEESISWLYNSREASDITQVLVTLSAFD